MGLLRRGRDAIRVLLNVTFILVNQRLIPLKKINTAQVPRKLVASPTAGLRAKNETKCASLPLECGTNTMKDNGGWIYRVGLKATFNLLLYSALCL